MKKNYYVTLIFLCLGLTFGFGQIITFDFNGLAGNEVSANSNFNDTNLNTSTITRGPGLTAANNGGRFNATSWALTNIGNAIAGDNYMEFTITPNSGYQFDVTSIDINFQRSGTGTRGILLRSSLDGYTSDIDTEKSIVDNTSVQSFTFTVGQTGNTSAVTYRVYGWAEATGGSGGFEGTGDDIVVNGSVTSTSTNTTVQFNSITSTLAEDGLFIDVCVSITNPSTSVATTVDIALDGSSTATNGSDYDDGAGTPAAIVFPQSLTFPANSSTDECITIYISNDDTDIEGDETVVLNLTNPNGGDSAALGTDTTHTLTITDNDVAAVADVVITEIMYNSTGTDDEWIEICNVSGSPQVLNDYTIEVGGSTEFTFPSSGVIIADGDCITVSLGSNGDGTYNNDCPFTPDYGINASTSDTNNLVNSSETISLIASDGTTTIDEVTYDNADDNSTDGNGSSYHVVDSSLDNSNTATNWQGVVDGGSPGINSLVSPCSALEPEINVEGDIGSFPDIANGDTTPSFLDNTQFSDQIILVGSQTKSFIIENLGTVDLSVSDIQIVGVDAADFSVTLPSSLPLTISPNTEIIFDVTFAPLSVAGTRNATVRITNNDSADGEGEEIYEFAIRGEAICDASSNVLTPLTGPDNTVVTITGNDLDGSTFVEFDGVVIPHTSVSSTEIEITIPANSSSANIQVTNNINCQSSDFFTIIDNAIGSCEGSGGIAPTDLFISEITDKSPGSHSYIELYNGTGATVNLADYEIRIHNNGNASPGSSVADLTGSVPNNSTYVIAIGGSNATDPEGGYTADEFYGFGGINDNDNIRLYYDDGVTETWIDLWGDTSGSTFTVSTNDYTYRRKNSGITAPSTTWDANDWDVYTPIDYSDIGYYDFSTGVPPTVTGISSSTTACNEVTISVSASEGFSGSNPLAYFWYAYDPANAGLGWQAISNGGIYTTSTASPDLIISDTGSVLDFQFYCQVRENDASCYDASNAIKVTLSGATWDGTNWIWNDGTAIDTMPDITTNVIINGNYDTSAGGIETSFSACSLVVNNGFDLDITNGTYIEISNDITANGNITVFPQGSVVQIDDLATVTGSGTMTVQKETTLLNTQYDYTYWSSPVVGETIENLFGLVPNYGKHYFEAANFVDMLDEIDNTNIFNSGQDDLDDDGNDWQPASGTMQAGVGYAAMPSVGGPAFPVAQQFAFVGPFNNGVVSQPLVNNSTGLYNDWNFIGNPYPSAISTATFFSINSGVTDAIYLWNQATPPNATASGSDGQNFSASDYAVISASGINTAGGDTSLIPNDYVPSGQGFFIEAQTTGPIVFNNSMRVTGNNNQFFRSNETNKEVLWLNLTSDNGVANQLAVAHLEGATDLNDGTFYDVKRNMSSPVHAALYSTITGEDTEFVIQGKNYSSLDLDEVITLGFKTTIESPTTYTISIAQFVGAFYTDNDIYLKDNLLNITHNIKNSDYNFTSTTGVFNNRFEVVFVTEALSINDNVISANDITISELQNDEVRFSTSKKVTITNVEILDVLGRQIYNLKGNSSTETYNLSQLSNAAYIAKISLSNGQVISKKAIKQR